jgi:hypothetical protein
MSTFVMPLFEASWPDAGMRFGVDELRKNKSGPAS